jgi:chromosomal replication initiation ATPase DnaA
VIAQCPTCDGLDFVYTFDRKSGPFDGPQHGGSLRYVEGEGWYIGDLIADPCPTCAGDWNADRLIRMSGLDGADLEIVLDTFKPLPGKEPAKQTAERIVADAQIKPSGFFTFHGNYGTGKTTLLKAIVNEFRLVGLAASYVRMADLLAEVRSGFDDNATESADQILKRFDLHRVLAVDEVDRVNITPWTREILFRFLDGRYSAQDRHLTLIATNTAPDDLPVDLMYLGSRMNGGIVVEVAGADVRPALGLKQQQEMFDE